MEEYTVGFVSNAIQSRGAVPSGNMLESGGHMAGFLEHHNQNTSRVFYKPMVYDFNNFESMKMISRIGKPAFLDYLVDFLHGEVQNKGIRLLCFSLYTNGFRDNARIMKELKSRNPDLVIMAGGPLVSWFDELLWRHAPDVDVMVPGKIDFDLGKLVDSVHADFPLSQVPGAIYRNGGKVHRNPRPSRKFERNIRLPYPIYDDGMYHPSISNKVLTSTLRTTFGCRKYPICSFCIQPYIEGAYAERDLEDVLGEVEHLGKRYGIRNFRLADPNPSPRQMKNFINGLPNGVMYSAFAYADHNPDYTAAKGKLVSNFVGIESLDPDTLAALNKTRNAESYKKLCERMVLSAKEAGICTVYANIAPINNDSSERILRDREEVLRLRPDFITALPIFVLPHTPLYDKIRAEGDASGVRLSENFLEDMMLYELDLLQDSKLWPDPPWQLRVDGKFEPNPFHVTARLFSGPLREAGIGMTSDEIVQMAHMYYGGLSENQDERMKQVMDYQDLWREMLSSEHLDESKLDDFLTRTNSSN